jgi:hypothetical protein
LTERPNRTDQIRRFPPPIRNNPAKYRRPFWLPASNYYILAAAVAIAFFFLVWGVLHEGEDQAPWVPAGFGASLILIGAVFLREIVLRKARNRYLLVQKRLDFTLDNATLHTKTNAAEKKLTLEKNAEIIKQIQKKSEAARVLMKLSEGHHEVFKICNEYLEINKKELVQVGAGSPRLAALRRGREIARDLHRFHLLAWAEIESRQLTQEAKNRGTKTEKTETAQMIGSWLNRKRRSGNSSPRSGSLIIWNRPSDRFLRGITSGRLVIIKMPFFFWREKTGKAGKPTYWLSR